MEENLTTILAVVLMLFTGYFAFESFLLKKVRVRGHNEGLLTIKPGQWFWWASRKNQPGAYYFWTTFYVVGFFFGAYILFVF